MTLTAKLHRLLQLVLLVNLIGIGVALAIWLYGHEIGLVNGVRLRLAALMPRALVLPVLGLLGGAVAGGLITFLEPAAKGSGIVQVMLFLRGWPIPMGWRVAIVKLLASGIAIGSGIPVGPEGPSIQIGASVARESARLTGAEHHHQRVAVAIGSGAGLGAVFHAPLGGLAYTLEELLKHADGRTNALAVAATFATIAWTRLLANLPTLHPILHNLAPIVDYPSRVNEFRLVDLPLLLLLGALAGVLAMLYQRWIQALRRRFIRWRLPSWQLLPLVGVAVGAGWSLLPSAFDNPDGLYFDALLGIDTAPRALLALAVQAAATAVAVAAEAPGGFLAPALVVGASLGTLLQQVSLALVHDAPASLLFAGAAAFLGALTRTPLTAILLTFELSKNYALLLPIGFCSLTAIAVADLFERETIFELLREEAERELLEPRRPEP
ncbi:chloride channel protein [Vulcanococcus limneticus]|uniref:chloride channel protein n=1 Tax=Vulcanococcus limneticus TaxID=2170428 RepID=UPI00398BEA91